MIRIKSTGNFRKTRKMLKKAIKANDIDEALAAYGEIGVELLAAATPVRSGTTASSWGYEIEKNDGSVKLVWTNSDMVGTRYKWNLAILIQYGHGTGTGGYVQGIDYINPALRPLFEEIADSIWKEVISV